MVPSVQPKLKPSLVGGLLKSFGSTVKIVPAVTGAWVGTVPLIPLGY